MQQVAVGIVMRDGLVLACQRRSSARYPLKWEFPGGKIEQDELPWDALLRELAEELDITATSGREFHRQTWTYPESSVDEERDGTFSVVYYLVHHFSGEPANKVFEQIRWVRPQELLHMDVLEGNREAIDSLVRHESDRTTRTL